MEEIKKACSFTGHRTLKEEQIGKLPALLGRAINYAYENGCRDFLSGGALGFDTVAAREVLRFRMFHRDVRLILVLPCINQDEKWSNSQRNAYHHLLGSADEIIYVADEYEPGCHKKRNEILAERGDVIISYVSRYNSGAAQTVRMAEKLGKTVYNLYPTLDRELTEK